MLDSKSQATIVVILPIKRRFILQYAPVVQWFSKFI